MFFGRPVSKEWLFNADVVYVGTVHPHHLSAGRLFMNSHKNVLIEKPLAMNAGEVTELISTAKRNKVFMMEVSYKNCQMSYTDV